MHLLYVWVVNWNTAVDYIPINSLFQTHFHNSASSANDKMIAIHVHPTGDGL